MVVFVILDLLICPVQVLLDGLVIYRTNAMKKGTWKNIHYIDQKELWEVKIKLDNPNQVTTTCKYHETIIKSCFLDIRFITEAITEVFCSSATKCIEPNRTFIYQKRVPGNTKRRKTI